MDFNRLLPLEVFHLQPKIRYIKNKYPIKQNGVLGGSKIELNNNITYIISTSKI